MKDLINLIKENGVYVIFAIIGAISGYMEINTNENIVKSRQQKLAIWLGYIMIALFGTKGAAHIIEFLLQYFFGIQMQLIIEVQFLLCILIANGWKRVVPTLSILINKLVSVPWKEIIITMLNSKKKE